MTRENFASRVQLLRDSWVERRQVSRIAGTHDFDSQFRLLATLHGWASEACEGIRDVYGDGLAIALSPLPERSDGSPAFSITVGDQQTVTFTLSERRRMSGPRWHVSVSVASSGSGGSTSQAGPERRNGQWSRTRLEDVLLSLLGAHERSLGDGDGGLRRRVAVGPGPGSGTPGVAL